jgi:hypothetical protein
MQAFLDDPDAISKLVATQYRVPADKLLRSNSTGYWHAEFSLVISSCVVLGFLLPSAFSSSVDRTPRRLVLIGLYSSGLDIVCILKLGPVTINFI